MKKKTKTQTKKELQQVINELIGIGCIFWACPGPNRPDAPMATCRICQQVKVLRKIKREM